MNKTLWYCCGFLFFQFTLSPLTLLKNVFALLGLSFTFSFFLILLWYYIASVGKRYGMLERRKSVCYFLGNFLLMFLILASSFNYPLVDQVLGGSASHLAFPCLRRRPDMK